MSMHNLITNEMKKNFLWDEDEVAVCLFFPTRDDRTATDVRSKSCPESSEEKCYLFGFISFEK